MTSQTANGSAERVLSSEAESAKRAFAQGPLRAGLEGLDRERGKLTDVAARIAERKADPYVLADEFAR